MEGEGRAQAYPGGWSDYAAQRPAAGGRPPQSPAPNPPLHRPSAAKPEAAAKPSGLSFTEKKRLDDLPDLIAKLESEIGKLSTRSLPTPRLFTREPVKFRKATEAMTDRQTALEARNPSGWIWPTGPEPHLSPALSARSG
jgi:ATP-binding cassette subfamily F protein uup